MDWKRMPDHHQIGEIKKGPWKPEEDEVLIKHVNKYGPRDWSSLRSNGLLHRTGKSCRLRWVNKLRPNLKNGVKFSAEEERTVIELQAQFGNKWARIATYLPGRTDNDVKNFWSSRQKRLARILQRPGQPSKSNKTNAAALASHVASIVEGTKFSSIKGESSSITQSCSSPDVDHSEIMKLVSLPELVDSKLPNVEQNLLQLEFISIEKEPFFESSSELPWPKIPQLQSELQHSFESQEVITRLGDPNVSQAYGHANASELDILSPFPGSQIACQSSFKEENGRSISPDSFMDDFPLDIFDQIEPLPSPSEW